MAIKDISIFSTVFRRKFNSHKYQYYTGTGPNLSEFLKINYSVLGLNLKYVINFCIATWVF